ncbi:MAG: lipopolysaccharide transport system ATP-binding protein [Acidobacteriota bacterium]|jgi:lipopolysaccharide transport system ATP-binding protein|nr:lipopolysaccharide transport system ATP-binding protein [Acidobacteriota bacterium]
MEPVVVRVENVSKRYRIGALHPGYDSFREALAGAVAARLRRLKRGGNDGRSETLWALSEVNLEVRRGEILGIVGRNGAGKSTLLKILSRITRPTAGEVEIFGRVGSLLEVGTGFHPDLTGRENIYLNGAILGMRKVEIENKFDEIVAFSELERFVETPVKFYSSGMYVRLAFSVAAHLEPEVLIMDEVLAVGDMAFQQKCLDKMHEIRQQGRTIFFVSHNLPAVTRLCKRAILLEAGRLVAEGPPHEVVNRYLSSSWKAGAERVWDDDGEAPGDGTVRLRRVRVCDDEGRTAAAVDVRRPTHIVITYDVLEEGHALTPVIELYNDEGTEVFSTHDTGDEWRRRARPRGRYTSAVTLPGNLLAEGSLIAHVSIMSHFPSTILHARAKNAVAFQVLDEPGGVSARGDYVGPMPGVVRPLLSWETRADGAAES